MIKDKNAYHILSSIPNGEVIPGLYILKVGYKWVTVHSIWEGKGKKTWKITHEEFDRGDYTAIDRLQNPNRR